MQLIRCLLSNFLSQHVSGIIMPIIGRIRPFPTACGVLPGCVGCGWLWSCGAASCTCTWFSLFTLETIVFTDRFVSAECLNVTHLANKACFRWLINGDEEFWFLIYTFIFGSNASSVMPLIESNCN